MTQTLDTTLFLYNLVMYSRTENQDEQDPYETIRRLRSFIDQQAAQLQEYQIACDSVMIEKKSAVKQASQLKRQVQYLSQRLQQQKSGKSLASQSSQSLFNTRVFMKQNRHNYLTMSPYLGKNDNAGPHLIVLNSPSSNTLKKQPKSKQFIPGETFANRIKTSTQDRLNSMIESSNQNIIQNVGQNFIQDVIIIGPDPIEVRKLQEQKEKKQFNIEEFSYVNYNDVYKNKKAEYLKDVARRSFPLGATVRRKLISNIQEFKSEMEFVTQGKMGQQYFIINLKGDFIENEKKKHFLDSCNPFKALFAVCLRILDFIPIRDQKYDQKQQQYVWMVEKVYVILTYYPIFNVHLSILSKIHQKLQPCWHKLQKEQMFSKNLQKNMNEAKQNQEVNKLISFFMNKKSDYNQICIHENIYFGTLPNLGFSSQYAIARFTCPIFFSIFAYEQMLLLITAIFLQKSIIIVSKSESAATLCCLFLTTIIAPFRYNQHLILNCDTQKVQNIVFQFPFILVASLKKPSNYSSILKPFIDNNSDRFKGFNGKDQTAPLMLVDIDSNCIFFDSMLNKTFEELIVSPSDALRNAYLAVNQSVSKSFTFPKKMPVQVYTVPKNDYQKNKQIRRKMQKQYQQKIDTNTSKWPTYSPTQAHLTILKLLTQHIQSFSISTEYQAELIKTTMDNSQARKQYSRKHLLQKHPLRQKFVDVLVQSQLFADYVDQIQKNIQT